MAEFAHSCAGQIVAKAIQTKNVPKFNRALYLQNKTKIGTVREILGPVNAFVNFELYSISQLILRKDTQLILLKKELNFSWIYMIA